MSSEIAPPSAKASSAGRILAFDGLRGVAATIVVIFHYLAMLHPRWVADFSADPVIWADTPLAVLWNGPFAVSVFFVLSGFVMAAAAERRHDRLIENVLTRYLRLALPVLASVLLANLWLTLHPTAAQALKASLDAPSAWVDFTIQAPLPGVGAAVHDALLGNFITGSSAFNNVLWTMQIELLGSIFLFLVYWLGGFRRWMRHLALAGFAVLALVALRDAYLCFVTGALIYEARKAGLLERLPPFAGVLAFALGILLGAPGQGFADRWGLDFLPGRLQPGNVWGLVPVLAASLILLGLQMIEPLKRGFEMALPQWLGRISFALYLVHVPLLYTFVAWERVNWGLPSPLVAAAYIAVVLALADVFTRLVDEPSLRLIAGMRKRTAALRAEQGMPMLPTGTKAARGAAFWPFVLLATGGLTLTAWANGGALLYYDSVVYLHRPEGFLRLLSMLPAFGQAVELAPQAAVMTEALSEPASETVRLAYSGRSMYYQIVGWSAFEFGRLWPLVAIHAFLVAYPAALLLDRVVGVRLDWRFVLAMTALGVLTPLGLVISVAMPDILVGVLALVIATLMAGWQVLGRIERGALFLIAIFAMVAHTSHLLLGLALPLVLLMLPLHKASLWRGAVLIWLAALSAMALETTQKTLQQRTTDSILLTRPHLVAHLVDHGPAVTYLQDACPEAGFEMCNHVDHLPIEWREFLFGGLTPESLFHAEAPAETKIAISREQFALTAAVVADDPVAVLDFAARAVLRQLVRFNPAGAVAPVNLPLPETADLPPWLSSYPDWVLAQIGDSYLMKSESAFAALHLSTWISTLLGIGALAWAAREAGGGRVRGGVLVLCSTLLLAVLFNAAICGILASPYDRFQARIIWLIPLAALALLAVRQSRTWDMAREPGAAPRAATAERRTG